MCSIIHETQETRSETNFLQKKKNRMRAVEQDVEKRITSDTNMSPLAWCY